MDSDCATPEIEVLLAVLLVALAVLVWYAPLPSPRAEREPEPASEPAPAPAFAFADESTLVSVPGFWDSPVRDQPYRPEKRMSRTASGARYGMVRG